MRYFSKSYEEQMYYNNKKELSKEINFLFDRVTKILPRNFVFEEHKVYRSKFGNKYIKYANKNLYDERIDNIALNIIGGLFKRLRTYLYELNRMEEYYNLEWCSGSYDKLQELLINYNTSREEYIKMLENNR